MCQILAAISSCAEAVSHIDGPLDPPPSPPPAAAMFHLGHPDVLPVGDLGVRRGMQALYKLKVCRRDWRAHEAAAHASGASAPSMGGQTYFPRAARLVPTSSCARRLAPPPQDLPDTAEMEAIAAPWRPFRSAGAYYMWRVEAPRAGSKKAGKPKPKPKADGGGSSKKRTKAPPPSDRAPM